MSGRQDASSRSPWPGLWALVIGFFMILVDTTIVSVANPAIKAALDPDSSNLDRIVWVTSAYLLAYAVPLLVTGRLGDRFGPKNIYLIGLAVFTLASLGCGLSTDLGSLVAMRAIQGLGAAMMTPQTMAVIARTFPPDRRGAAMGLWGSVSGVALLVGPLAGGLLTDTLGWEWIFFVNVPVGVVAFVLAWVLVPTLETHPHRFDFLGVFLSATALFLIVFGLQEGNIHDWGTIWGPITVWGVIIAGVAMLGLFFWQQAVTRSEPLVPLALFRDRTFAISNIAIAAVGFAVTNMSLPLMFFLQFGRDLTPTEAGLILVPLAVCAAVLAPGAGKLFDRADPRVLLVPGIALVALSMALYTLMMTPETPIWLLLIPSTLMGVGSAGMWGPLANMATRGLPRSQAGAGSGIYTATRTVGGAIGAASIAAFMQARLLANVPDAAGDGDLISGPLPPGVREGFVAAMAQTILLPAAVLLIAVVAVCFLRRVDRAQVDAWHASSKG